MLCGISGEAPEVPVASRKTGTVYEKRLIEAYVAEHGVEPGTDEALTVDDLIDLKCARVVRPRPPTLTSIPSLLATFQNEWDALALETYKLKQQLAQTRQELSTALYQQDAAVRVIARLSREKEEARNTLSSIKLSTGAGTGGGDEDGGTATNGDAMQLDGKALPDDLAAKVEETQQRLSSTRRKRRVPAGWASSETVSGFDTTASTGSIFDGSSSIALDDANELAVVGGSDGVAGIYSVSEQKRTRTLPVGKGSVLSAVWWKDTVIVGISTGAVKIIGADDAVEELGSHSGAATSLSLHPCGDLLASVGQDHSYMIYDLLSKKIVTQVNTNTELTCGQFHPDGHLFGAGAANGDIKLFDVKSSENVANFETHHPVTALAFSENGTWLAVAGEGQTAVQIWDLRKTTVITNLEVGSAISALAWDYTGQFLAVAGRGNLLVHHYKKSSKSWSEPLRKAATGVGVSWGPKANSILLLTASGSLDVLAAS